MLLIPSLAKTMKHVCDPKSAKGKDDGKKKQPVFTNSNWNFGNTGGVASWGGTGGTSSQQHPASVGKGHTAKLIPMTPGDITIMSGVASLIAGLFGGPVAAGAAYGGVNSFLTSLHAGDPAHVVLGKTAGGSSLGAVGGRLLGGLTKTKPLTNFLLGTAIDTGMDQGISAINGNTVTPKSIGASLLINGLFNGLGTVLTPKKPKANVSNDPNPYKGLTDQQIADSFVRGLEDITEHGNWGTKQFKATGGYNGAINKFNSLELKDVRPFIDSYGGQAYRGSLPDGTTVVVRSWSSYGAPTIEFQFKGRKYEIRYGD